MKKIKIKNKKYLFLGLVTLAVIMGVLFQDEISSLYVQKAEEANLSLSPIAGVTKYDVNYKANAGSSTAGCNNRTYTPTITNSKSNVFGPFSYPVKMRFKGTVDDNLKVNGVIVDKSMELKGGKCSHKHDVDYSQNIPAGQTVKIEVVDNYGVEASLIGQLTFTRTSSPSEKVYLKLIHEYNYNAGSGNISNVAGSYDKYSKVTIEAYPNKGSAIVWARPCVGAKNKCTVNLFENTEVHYTFVPKKKWWQKCKFEGIPGEVGFKLVCPW